MTEQEKLPERFVPRHTRFVHLRLEPNEVQHTNFGILKNFRQDTAIQITIEPLPEEHEQESDTL